MDDKSLLTLTQARRWQRDDEPYLDGFTVIEDDAAELIGKLTRDLDLMSVTHLSDRSAYFLSLGQGRLDLSSLEELTDAALASLLQRKGIVTFGGLRVSLKQVALLAQHPGRFIISPDNCEKDVQEALRKVPQRSDYVNLASQKVSECDDPDTLRDWALDGLVGAYGYDSGRFLSDYLDIMGEGFGEVDASDDV